jgi:hypothetical protein
MKIKIILFSLLLSLNAMAQVAGYMGKRFIVGYSNYFSPAIGVNANTANGLGINTTHCLNIEFVIKERTSLCLTAQRYNTGLIDKEDFNSDNNNGYGYGYSFARYAAPIQLKTEIIGIGFKFFKRGHIAPVGNYKKVELLLLSSNLTYDKNGFMAEPYGGTVPAIGTGNYSNKTIALAYTIGRQRILFNRLVLDMGLRFALVPTAIIAYIDPAADFKYKDLALEKRFRYDTDIRSFAAQVFNFHIGIGFLAF